MTTRDQKTLMEMVRHEVSKDKWNVMLVIHLISHLIANGDYKIVLRRKALDEKAQTVP